MRRCLHIFIFIFWISILSCSDTEDQIPTIVKGMASDVTRNIPSPGLKIYIQGWSIGSTNIGGLAGANITSIDSTVSDASGKFELKFNDIPGNTHGLSFETYHDKFGYYADVIADTSKLEPEIVNIRNIDAWKPVVIKLNLNILNNNNPDLIITNETWPEDNYFFGSAIIIQEKEIDTTVFLPAKPNAEHRIVFNYKTGTHNEVFHNSYEFLKTELQDTLQVDYIIDCSLF